MMDLDFDDDGSSGPPEVKTPIQHWDPHPHQRVWYRSAVTGDRGWMVIRDGVDSIKLDRPNQEIVRPYYSSEWAAEKEHRPMTIAQVAQVAFAADRQLCTALQLYGQGKTQWIDLPEEKKIRWYNEGPKNPVRAKLYLAVRKALEDQVG